MHELGIVEDLIKSIQERIKDKEDIKHIKKIYVRLGNSMNISEDSLKLWFENLSQGTQCAGAILDVSLVDDKGITVDSLEVE